MKETTCWSTSNDPHNLYFALGGVGSTGRVVSSDTLEGGSTKRVSFYTDSPYCSILKLHVIGVWSYGEKCSGYRLSANGGKKDKNYLNK